jgi:hypothetical protein
VSLWQSFSVSVCAGDSQIIALDASDTSSHASPMLVAHWVSSEQKRGQVAAA